MRPFLSIIIPAHNEEQRLPDSLEQIFAFLADQRYTSEVLVVENGSKDRTLEVAQEYTARFPNLIVLHNQERGKGLAVRRGMLSAQGEYRFMCDADLSMPIEQVNQFLPPLCADFDIVIASREMRGAVRHNEPSYRHWGGRIINLIIRLLAVPKIQDTQCGFKCFRSDVAEDLFSIQTMTGWSFDIELLFVARQRGYAIAEIPIHWYYRSESKLNVLHDAIHMILDIFTIRSNARRGLYDEHP